MKKHSDMSKDKPMMQKVAKKAVKKHVDSMHKGQKMSKGGGVKIRGTGAATKGTMARGPMG